MQKTCDSLLHRVCEGRSWEIAGAQLLVITRCFVQQHERNFLKRFCCFSSGRARDHAFNMIGPWKQLLKCCVGSRLDMLTLRSTAMHAVTEDAVVLAA